LRKGRIIEINRSFEVDVSLVPCVYSMRRLCSDEYVYVADELINQSINQSINHSIYCYMAARRFIPISLVVYVLAVERECRVCTYVLAEDCKLQFSLCCTCNDVSTGRAGRSQELLPVQIYAALTGNNVFVTIKA